MKTFGKNMWSWSDNDHIFWGVLKGAGVVWELGVGVGVVGVGVVGAGLGSGSGGSGIGEWELVLLYRGGASPLPPAPTRESQVSPRSAVRVLTWDSC